MTCRHGPYDPNCGSYKSDISTLKSDYKREILGQLTPDSEKFEIEEVEEVGSCLVMKVSYPNCKTCAYEGIKVMVFENVKIKDAIKWKKIDPHFRKPSATVKKTEAPGPVARFPASEQGWKDAMEYAKKRKE